MSRRNEQSYNGLFHGIAGVIKTDLIPSYPRSLEDFLEPFRPNQEFQNVASISSTSQESYDLEEHEHPSSSPVILSPLINQSYSDQIPLDFVRILQQPFQSSKLRYRADYNREKRRVGSLTHKTQRSPLKGPAITIPQRYLDFSNDYYIRVTLLTTRYDQTNVHYFHPYELEDAKSEGYNDRTNNSVWFPITSEDSIRNFPFLRIVKKRAFEIQKLRAFDCYPHISSDSLAAEHAIDEDIDVHKEYNIEKSQLAFTLARKTFINDQICMILHKHTTVFSEEMTENDEKQADEDSSTEQASPNGRNYVSKYAPKSGPNRSDEEMLVYFRKKLDLKKHGNIYIAFECETVESHWTHIVQDFDVEDRMVSFQIPSFPYEITNSITVDIILQQQNRLLGVLKYSYLPRR